MYTNLSGFRFPIRSYSTPTVEAPKISLATPVVKEVERIEAAAIPMPRPKPAYIPPPPVVAPVAPIPVVNIRQAAPAPKAAMPKWAVPAMVGGGGLILLLALMPKKKAA